MSVKYASGKNSIAACDRCGFRFKLKQLKRLVIKTRDINILVCPECWEPDQPQLQLGMYPIIDPQAIENPRPDRGGSDIQWGWDPVGGAPLWVGTVNNLVAQTSLGSVSINTSDVIFPVTGVVAYAELGDPFYAIEGATVVFEPLGLSATVSLGTVTTAYDYVQVLTGEEATGELGSVVDSTSIVVTPTGEEAVSSLGNVTVTFNHTQTVTGLLATTYLGTVTAAAVPHHWLGVLWVNAAGNNVANGIAVDSGDNIYLAGKTTDGNKYMLAKYGSDSTLAWQRTLSDPGSSSESYEDVAVDSSDNVYAVGYSSASIIALVKYNSSGTIQWQKSLGTSSTYGRGIAVSSSNNLYIAGTTGSSLLTAKYDSSGTLQWQRVLSPAGGTINGRKVAVDSSENTYVVGDWGGSGTILLVKYNSSGTLQWQRTLTSATACRGYDVALDSSGNPYLVGIIYNGFSDPNIFLAKYNSSGVLQWQRQLGDTATDERGYGIAIDSSDFIHIIGTDFVSTTTETTILAKYNSSGSIQWQNKITPSVTAGYALALDSDGNVCLAGTTNRTTLGTYGGMFLARLPADGSLTGTYSGYTYATSTYVDASASLTGGTSTYTDAAGSLTAGTTSFTDAAGTSTSSTYTID